MAFSLSHIHDYNRFISLDLGTYRAKVGVYDIEDMTLKEVGYATVRQNRKNFVEGEIDNLSGVMKTVVQAITHASKDLDEIPKDIIASFSSQYFITDTISTQYLRSDPNDPMTMDELDTMIKKTEGASFRRAREKAYKKLGGLSTDLRLVSSTITRVNIDEQRVVQPIGSKGKKVSLCIINIFVPSSQFNIIKSLMASLDERTISLIPTPLVLPKIVEQTEYALDTACYIDIGYTYTNITLTQNNEIYKLETFPVGTRMLMENIRDAHKKTHGTFLSLLQIENIIWDEQAIRGDVYRAVVADFFEYISDMIAGFLQENTTNIRFSHAFFHGNIFENPYVTRTFGRYFEKLLGYSVRKKRMTTLIPREFRHQEAITYGLSLIASELLFVKKDPLVRILRYVLYNYE
ncbi:hypothetical protein CSB09_02905 [Candidatus Gracilibacteria bacterium]|nr:MAG: hypothetical protein CSB09_02905 [Candidatus Gracilibacteria bacterium]